MLFISAVMTENTIVVENGLNETIPYTQLNEKREPNIAGIKILCYKMIKHVSAKFKT